MLLSDLGEEIEVYRILERDGRVDAVDSDELCVHPVGERLVEVDEGDVPRACGDLRLDPGLARLGIALERAVPLRVFGIPRVMTLQRRDNDEIRARLVRIGEIGLEVVCVAFRAGLVVSVFDIELVAWLEKAALAVRIRARG